MTPKNQELRDSLKQIETTITSALAHQPEDDAQCGQFLYDALVSVFNTADLAAHKYRSLASATPTPDGAAPTAPEKHADIISEIRAGCAKAYWSEDSLHPSGGIPEIKCLEPHKLVDRLEAAYARDLGVLSKLYDILSGPDLERPDGTPCYCNPDVPNRMEDFGTSSEFGVCDGESKEVFNESIADALSAVARAQMLLGIADYKRKGQL